MNPTLLVHFMSISTHLYHLLFLHFSLILLPCSSYHLSLYRVTVYCLCRCVPQENWLLFSLKWQSSDEALKCVEACPSALGSDWTTAIVQVVFVFLNWIEPDQLNTQTAFYWVRCGGESSSLAFYFPYRENKVLFLIHRLMLPQIGWHYKYQYQGCCNWSSVATDTKRLSSWLKNLSVLISFVALCYGLDCRIPILWANLLFEGKKKSPACRGSHFSPLGFP